MTIVRLRLRRLFLLSVLALSAALLSATGCQELSWFIDWPQMQTSRPQVDVPEPEDAPDPNTPTRMSAKQLDLWNSEEFQAQLAESNLPNTAVEPPVTTLQREQFQRVYAMLENNRMDDAANLLEEYRQDPTASARVDYMLGNIYFQRKQLDYATKAYQRAVKKYANYRDAHQQLGLVLVRQDRFRKAIDSLTKAIELGANDDITNGLLGFAYAALGKHIAAEKAFSDAMKLNPKNENWKMGLARSYFEQRRFAEAASFTSTLIEEAPDNPSLWLLQANAYLGMNENMKAAENFEIVAHMGAATADTMFTLGDIYINEELYGMAVDSYARAMESDEKGNTERPIRAVKVLSARGALEETERLIQEVRKLRSAELTDAQQKDLLWAESRIKVARGDTGGYVDILKVIVERDPLDGEAMILLGRHYRNENDLERAELWFKRAAGIEEHEADACIQLGMLEAGRRQYKEALSYLKRAQKLKPSDKLEEYIEEIEKLAGRSS